MLMEDRTIRFQEGVNDVAVNLEEGRSAFPTPMFEWTQNGQPAMNGSGRVFGYPSLTISSVARTDRGMYTLSARNFELGTTNEIGNDAGTFTLDVLCKSHSSLVYIVLSLVTLLHIVTLFQIFVVLKICA